MWWVGVAGLVVVEWRGVIECGLVLVEFLGGLVVIEMVGGCRIGGGGLTHVFVHTVNIIFTLCILFINVD